MKALILNSGLGKRMGHLTQTRPKGMVEIFPGVSPLDLQIQKLLYAGIKDTVITTGPFAKVLEDYVTDKYPDMQFTFVNNPDYASTNYIYSIALAKQYLTDTELVLMHGDLVFEDSVLQDVLSSKESVMVVDSTLPLPEKDFKAVVENGKITEVGIEFFDSAMAAQPLYHLTKEDWNTWLTNILEFCKNGNKSVYAENAMNVVSNNMNVQTLDVKGRLCGEIDTEEDLVFMRNRLI